MSKDSPYILGKRIARGGMAEIFLAKAVGSDDFQKICAVKKILPHYAQEKEYVEMFRAEASICKRLQHANIVQVHDFKKVDDSYAIIMEFVDGVDLRALLAACEKTKTRLTPAMAIYVAVQSARGLHYAHTRVDELTNKKLDIVHRDISPQNILLSYEGEVKVIDFGIAKFETRTQETKPGVVKGKYSYMSPEQVSAKPLDARTDVFSLSIVLWEMLGMKRLFAAETEVETIKNVQGCVIKRSLMDLNPAVDEELYDIILRGLAKERKRRYESAAALEKDLARYLNRKYPEFIAADLANFVRNMFVQKRQETQKFVQDLLTLNKKEAPREEPVSFPAEQKSDARGVPIEAIVHAKKPEEKVSIVVDAGVSSIPLSGAGYGIKNAFKTAATGSESIQSVSLDLFGKPQSQKQQTLPPNDQSERSRPSRQTWQNRNSRSSTYPMSDVSWAEKSNLNIAYYVVGLGIALLFIVGFIYLKSNNPATPTRGNMQVLMSTIPESVSISVDGKSIDDGAYIETPRRFSLPPGRHTMTISRENYLTRKVEIEGRAGDVLKAENINLVPDPSINTTTVNISSKTQRLYIVVENGLFKGTTPARISGLTVGKRYTLTAYPNFPQKRGGFRCNFIPQAKQGAFTVTIFISADGSNAKCIGN